MSESDAEHTGEVEYEIPTRHGVDDATWSAWQRTFASLPEDLRNSLMGAAIRWYRNERIAKQRTVEELLDEARLRADDLVRSIRDSAEEEEAPLPSSLELLQPCRKHAFQLALWIAEEMVNSGRMRELAQFLYRHEMPFVEVQRRGYAEEEILKLCRRVEATCASALAPSRTLIAISYAREDKAYLDRFLVKVAPLQRRFPDSLWWDERIRVGNNWTREIPAKLKEASAFVLLVSGSYLASDYLFVHEVPAILQRASAIHAPILPAVLDRCLVDTTRFRFLDPSKGYVSMCLSDIQGVNSVQRPLSDLPSGEQDLMLYQLAQEVEKLLPP